MDTGEGTVMVIADRFRIRNNLVSVKITFSSYEARAVRHGIVVRDIATVGNNSPLRMVA